MNLETEEFFHFETCLDRLHSAWRTLDAIKRHPNHILIGPAFRFALVEYATSYTQSIGKHKRHSLDVRYIPLEFMDLHERLIETRHQVHAHADIAVLDGSISITDLDGQRLVTRVQNSSQELEELRNIDEIMRLIEATIDGMCADRDRRIHQLKS